MGTTRSQVTTLTLTTCTKQQLHKKVLKQQYEKFAKIMFHDINNKDLIRIGKLQKKHLERQLENLANKTLTTTVPKKMKQYELLVFHNENFQKKYV